MRARVPSIAVLTWLGAVAPAWAGPCQAPAPDVGAELHGPVLHVLDGRRLCIALGATPDRWVEVEVAEAGLTQATSASPRPRGDLMAAAFGQNVTCKVVGRGTGAPLAACTLNGQSVDKLADRAHAARAGQLWR